MIASPLTSPSSTSMASNAPSSDVNPPAESCNVVGKGIESIFCTGSLKVFLRILDQPSEAEEPIYFMLQAENQESSSKDSAYVCETLFFGLRCRVEDFKTTLFPGYNELLEVRCHSFMYRPAQIEIHSFFVLFFADST
ncbi:hypothetical protein PGT21_010007 [Puccinia graminis f. sp. tritici]|uniref:Uncharacterized protein n=1 Tax=Puccinia graminis f. sp. tritici TaxID=56615 RepID=A0A5B0P616_PUCGR|nr:hypothetical protein PGT21_010007 [Puccinia graminis f. sp. tritici]